jgi:hypothetical protein
VNCRMNEGICRTSEANEESVMRENVRSKEQLTSPNAC